MVGKTLAGIRPEASDGTAAGSPPGTTPRVGSTRSCARSRVGASDAPTVFVFLVTREQSKPLDPAAKESRWLDGFYLDTPEEWDDPYRHFRW